MLKKNFTPLYVREKNFNSRGLGKKIVAKLNHPYPFPLQKSNGEPHKGTDIHQQNGWRTFIMGWSKVLHFKMENTRIKDTNVKRKFKRMLSFLFPSLPRSRFSDVTQRSPKSSRSFWERCVTSKNGCEGDYFFVDKRELLAMKLSFEVFNLVFCTADQSAGLF